MDLAGQFFTLLRLASGNNPVLHILRYENFTRSSLRRLQVEQRGIGLLHSSTAKPCSFPGASFMGWASSNVRQGFARAIGVSYYGPKRLLKIYVYLNSRGVPLCSAQVAINWCICRGTIPIPGVKSVRQVEENLGALGWRLSSNEIFQFEQAVLESPSKMIRNIFQTK